MEAILLRLGGRPVLVGRPRHHALGLLVADVLVLLHVAQARHYRLLLLEGPNGEDSPLLRLDAPTIERIRRPSVLGRIVAAAWPGLLRLRHLTHSLLSPRNAVVEGTRALLWRVVNVIAALAGWRGSLRNGGNFVISGVQKWCRGGPGAERAKRIAWRGVAVRWLERRKFAKLDKSDMAPGSGVLVWARRMDARLTAAREPASDDEVYFGIDVRELSVRARVPVRFAPADERSAVQAAAALGLAPQRFVTLHVREGGSRRAAGSGGRDRDEVRDACIDAYRPAIEEIVRRGYAVARIGDPTMTPLALPGVIDLACHPQRTTLLDFWCVANARFFISSDSGPYLLSWLFDVPCLSVNITNVLGVYPLRTRDLYVTKRLEEVSSGRPIPLAEMLSADFIQLLRRRLHKETTLRYVDNTPDEIREAIIEMCDAVECGLPAESPLQAEYRKLIAAARSGLHSRSKLKDKMGLHEVFLGEGRVVHSFAARHMYGAGQVA